MKKVGVTGVQIPTPSMRFSSTLLCFPKLISSIKSQVCNIFKNSLYNQIFLTYNIHLENYFLQKWFLHKFDIFINKRCGRGINISLTLPKLPSNDEITRFDGRQICAIKFDKRTVLISRQKIIEFKIQTHFKTTGS